MKKALSFAVALGLVAGLASVASAADMLTIHGDARWRGVYKNNAPMMYGADFRVADDTQNNTVQEMDQRYRVNADLQINDDVKINGRVALADQIFGNDQAMNYYVDRANMTIKTLGGSWTLGRQDASWGNKFLAYGLSVDRVKATYKAGDLTYGGYLQKNKEGADISAENGDGDNDTWGAFLVGKAGDASWGLLLNYVKDDTNATKASGKDTGYLVDPFVTAKVGPATVMAELVYKGGDLLKNSEDKAIWGGFVAGAMDMAPVSVKGLIAYYKNNEGTGVGGSGRDCDNDFAPSLLIGTCNETAIIDFGGTTSTGDDSTYLVGAGVDFKASDKVTVGALVGYLMATDKGGYCTTAGCEEAASLVEVDLTASYELAQNATYNFGIAYGSPDKFSEKDDPIIVVGNRVDVKW